MISNYIKLKLEADLKHEENELQSALDWYPFFSEKTRERIKKDPKWINGRKAEINHRRKLIAEINEKLKS